MFLLSRFFTTCDFFVAPLCFLVLMMIFSVVVKKYKDDKFKKLFLRVFYFKMICTLLFAIITDFYYKGGDSEMYFYCIKHLQNAVMDDPENFIKIYTTKMINVKTTLMNYFIFTDSPYPDFEAMHDPGNFWVPKFGLPFGLIFNMSYISIAMFFFIFCIRWSYSAFQIFLPLFP